MDRTDDVMDRTRPGERASRPVLAVVTFVAFLVPWATAAGGPAWWSTNAVPIGVWLVIGAAGVVLVVVGGGARRFGTALIAGDVLGALLFLSSFFIVLMVAYGGGSGG